MTPRAYRNLHALQAQSKPVQKNRIASPENMYAFSNSFFMKPLDYLLQCFVVKIGIIYENGPYIIGQFNYFLH